MTKIKQRFLLMEEADEQTEIFYLDLTNSKMTVISGEPGLRA